MAGCKVYLLVVNLEKVQVEIKHQAAGVLSVHLQLLDRLDVSSSDVEQLKVNKPVQKLKVHLGLLVHFLKDAGDGLTCALARLNILKGLDPPVQTGLRY